MRALETEKFGQKSTTKPGTASTTATTTSSSTSSSPTESAAAEKYSSTDSSESSKNGKPKNPTASTVFLGTRYEYLAKHRLEAPEFGMRLTRVGGRGDKGVDLLGIWRLPVAHPTPPHTSKAAVTSSQISSPSPSIPKPPLVRILIQTKRLAPQRPSQPSHLRELEGTLNAAFPISTSTSNLTSTPVNPTALAWRHFITTSPPEYLLPEIPDHKREHEREQLLTHPSLPTLGIFISTSPATKGVEDLLRSSRRALLYIQLRELPSSSSSSSSSPSTTTTPAHQKSKSNSRATPASHSTSNHKTETEESERKPSIPATEIKQILWNQAASDIGLGLYSVGTRNYTSTLGGRGDGEAVLIFGERVVGS